MILMEFAAKLLETYKSPLFIIGCLGTNPVVWAIERKRIQNNEKMHFIYVFCFFFDFLSILFVFL